MYKAVCEHEDITVLWNKGVQTDKMCLFIDIAIPSDRNVKYNRRQKRN